MNSPQRGPSQIIYIIYNIITSCPRWSYYIIFYRIADIETFSLNGNNNKKKTLVGLSIRVLLPTARLQYYYNRVSRRVWLVDYLRLILHGLINYCIHKGPEWRFSIPTMVYFFHNCNSYFRFPRSRYSHSLYEIFDSKSRICTHANTSKRGGSLNGILLQHWRVFICTRRVNLVFVFDIREVINTRYHKTFTTRRAPQSVLIIYIYI